MRITSARLDMTPLTEQDWLLFQQLHHTPEVIAQCFDVPTDAELQQKFQSRLRPWHKDAHSIGGKRYADHIYHFDAA